MWGLRAPGAGVFFLALYDREAKQQPEDTFVGGSGRAMLHVEARTASEGRPYASVRRYQPTG
jgi:hypothetical protein